MTIPETHERAIRSALAVMQCIECGGSLDSHLVPRRSHVDTGGYNGTLRCRDCDREYPIVAGSPVMLNDRPRVPDAEVETRRNTAESFAYEWKHFGKLRTEWERNFRDYLRPHDPESLEDLLVLDVGAGSGRHSYEAHRFGARVIAVDIGDAIRVARRNLPDEVVTIQADAENLPFEDGSFDLVLAIGVLHHLPDPQRALQSLARVVRPGGYVHIYVYWIPPYEWHRRLVGLVGHMRQLTTRMPHPLLRMLCYPVAAAAFTTFVLPYRISRRLGILDRIARALPLKTYADYPLNVCVNDTFDRFSAPLEARFTFDEVETMLIEAGFTEIVVTDNHGWIGSGRCPPDDSK